MSALNSQEQMVLAVIAILAIVVVLAVNGALAIAWLWTHDDVQAGRREPLFSRTWSLVDPWVGGQIVAALLIGAVILVGVALAPLALLRPGTEMVGPGFLLGMLIAQNVFLAAVPLGYMLIRYRADLTQIGLTSPGRRQVVIGVAAGLAMLLVGASAEVGVSALAKQALPASLIQMLERLNSSLSAGDLFSGMVGSWPQFAMFAFAVAVAAPIGEEVFYRAFLHRCATKRLGRGWGTLVSAGAFALVHGGPMMIVAILPMGIMLAVAYDRSKSLWVPIIMHAVNNGMMVVAMRVAPELAK